MYSKSFEPGSTSITVLPNSGTDISAANEAILCLLNEHADILVSSSMVPKAANGTEMHLIGKLPVSFWCILQVFCHVIVK